VICTPRNWKLSAPSTAALSMWVGACSPLPSPFTVVHDQLLGFADVEEEVVVPALRGH
jgi:hypothetical protein